MYMGKGTGRKLNLYEPNALAAIEKSFQSSRSTQEVHQ